MKTPIPTEKDPQMWVYYYLITGDRRAAFALANYFPNGRNLRRAFKINAFKKIISDNLIERTVNRLATNRLVLKRPKHSPESKLMYVEDVIATAEEVLIYLTMCMRGQIDEEHLLTRLTGDGVQVIERLRKQVGARDRTKAAELLAKRYGLLEFKYNIDSNSPVLFLGDGELELED